MMHTVINYPCFIDKDSEAHLGTELAQGCTVKQWKIWTPPRKSGFRTTRLNAPLSCQSVIILNHWVLLRKEGVWKAFRTFPITHSITSEMCVCVCLPINVRCPVSEQGIKRMPDTSVVGYRGKNIKGNPKSWTTYMQDCSPERLCNVNLCVSSSHLKIIGLFLLRKENHSPLGT